MVERRKSLRSRTYLGGQIAFNHRASTMNCHVRNLSAAGAKVVFANTSVIPDQFDLTIARQERSFKARMVWRGFNEAGVTFLNEYTSSGPVSLQWAKRLRDCEAERTALRQRIARLTESSAV